MKHCSKCGQLVEDDAQFCPSCGILFAVDNNSGSESGAQNLNCAQPQTYKVEATVIQGPTNYQMSESDKTLRLIAFIFNLISTIGLSILIIPLAWMIPMTVISWGIYKGRKANTVAFGVCTLIFVNLISGILLLCSKKDR